MSDPERQELIDAAITSARMKGCTCDPEVVPIEIPTRKGKFYKAQVGHDDRCNIWVFVNEREKL